MKKKKRNSNDSDMRDEYDFSGLSRFFFFHLSLI